MSESGIQWTERTWSPYIGCTPCSPGCDNCWAKREEDGRFRHLGRCCRSDESAPTAKPWPYFWRGPVYQGNDKLSEPRHRRKPTTYSVCPRSDLFHPDIGLEMIWRVLNVAWETPRHKFIFCTKRAKRALQVLTELEDAGSQRAMPDNSTLLVSISNQHEADIKIPLLLQCPAAMRGVSIEPILGPVDLMCIRGKPWLGRHGEIYRSWMDSLTPYKERKYPKGTTVLVSAKKERLDWVIVGCESGKNARPMELFRARRLRDQCAEAGVPFFMKQLRIDGKLVHDIEKFPEDLRIRQLPWENEK